MTVGGGLGIDGPLQVKPLNDRGGSQVKVFVYKRQDGGVRQLPCAEGIYQHGNRTRHADGVGNLKLQPVRLSRRHQVLGDVPGCVGCAPSAVLLCSSKSSVPCLSIV